METIIFEGEDAEAVLQAVITVREASPTLAVMSDSELIEHIVRRGLTLSEEKDGHSMTDRERQKQSIIRMLELADDVKLQEIYFFILHLV